MPKDVSLIKISTICAIAASATCEIRADLTEIYSFSEITNEVCSDCDWGSSIATGADVIVVGARLDDIPYNSGSAYVYRRNGGTWELEVKLTASDGESFDEFGTSVSISADGSVIAIGAPGADRWGEDSGLAYIFEYTGDEQDPWIEVVTFEGAHDHRCQNDQFGQTVQLTPDGKHLLVIAPGFYEWGCDSSKGGAWRYRMPNGFTSWGEGYMHYSWSDFWVGGLYAHTPPNTFTTGRISTGQGIAIPHNGGHPDYNADIYFDSYSNYSGVYTTDIFFNTEHDQSVVIGQSVYTTSGDNLFLQQTLTSGGVDWGRFAQPASLGGWTRSHHGNFILKICSAEDEDQNEWAKGVLLEFNGESWIPISLIVAAEQYFYLACASDKFAVIDQGTIGIFAVYDIENGGNRSCRSDINSDHKIDRNDLMNLLNAWGAPGGPEDINDNGLVEVLDLITLLKHWGACP